MYTYLIFNIHQRMSSLDISTLSIMTLALSVGMLTHRILYTTQMAHVIDVIDLTSCARYAVVRTPLRSLAGY